MSEPVWASTQPAPDALPKYKKRLNPDYPDELRKNAEPGYVIVERYMDAAGETQYLQAAGSHLPFQRSVENQSGYWRVAPAKRAGQPIDTVVWISVIFNPLSAAIKAPEATPRLLEVWPVLLQTHDLKDQPSAVVPMSLSLDETGAIVSATSEAKIPEDVGQAVAESLKHWKFAPARKAGKAVSAELVVPVVCLQSKPTATGKAVPPKPLKRAEPVYPYAMRQFGLEGRVRFEFDIDTSGKVQNPVIVQSTNPAFDEPALEALLKWTYRPATIDGRPVNIRGQLDIIFNLPGGGEDAFRIRKGDQSKLPPEFRFDVPPKIRGVQIPVYPYEQRYKGVSGTAKATMVIDPQGRVSGVKVTAADQPEFGLALAAALEGFAFDPALKDGKPVSCLIGYEQKFSSFDLSDEAGDWCLADERTHSKDIVAANVLDAPLKPVSRRSPIFPVTAQPGTTTGTAVIECLIDRRGRARLPRIIEASDPAFGYAAVQALAAWWFEPPKSHGEPVVVRVRVPFDFVIENPAAPKDQNP